MGIMNGASQRKMIKRRYRAAYGGMYWFLDDDYIPQCVSEKGDSFDQKHYDNCNYFKSKRDATLVANYMIRYFEKED